MPYSIPSWLQSASTFALPSGDLSARPGLDSPARGPRRGAYGRVGGTAALTPIGSPVALSITEAYANSTAPGVSEDTSA